jgi:hypothetical protein
VALGQVFSEYFDFPCQFSFHRLLHTHLLLSGAGTKGQLVADVPSGFSLTPSQETKKILNCSRYPLSSRLVVLDAVKNRQKYFARVGNRTPNPRRLGPRHRVPSLPVDCNVHSYSCKYLKHAQKNSKFPPYILVFNCKMTLWPQCKISALP